MLESARLIMGRPECLQFVDTITGEKRIVPTVACGDLQNNLEFWVVN